jgi:hypothetical protein
MNIRTPFGLFAPDGQRLTSFGGAVSFEDGNPYATPTGEPLRFVERP